MANKNDETRELASGNGRQTYVGTQGSPGAGATAGTGTTPTQSQTQGQGQGQQGQPGRQGQTGTQQGQGRSFYRSALERRQSRQSEGYMHRGREPGEERQYSQGQPEQYGQGQ